MRILWPQDLPLSLKGCLAVVIDVFAATSNIPWMISQYVNDLILVTEKSIIQARKQYPQAQIVGESADPTIKFSATNFLSNLQTFNVRNKTILYMTDNGTRKIQLAIDKMAGKVITASFVNLRAVISYLKNADEEIIVVPSGEYQLPSWGYRDDRAMEDWLCAKAIIDGTKGKDIILEKYTNPAEEFIRRYYPIHPSVEADLKLTLHSTQLDVVPICSSGKDGFIHIHNNL